MDRRSWIWRVAALAGVGAVVGPIVWTRRGGGAVGDGGVTVLDGRYGIIGDGVREDTGALQAAIDAAAARGGGRLLLRRPARAYVASSVSLRSNVWLELEPGTVIRAPAGLDTHEVVLRIHNVVNVGVSGGIIDGNRAAQGPGEFRHGVSIRGARDVSVHGVMVRRCAGDGFYIGSTDAQRFSENVVLEDCRAAENRRQGISLISGRQVSIIRARLTDTQGRAPQTGLNIEPNDPREVLQGIRINDLFTSGNRGGGILLALWQLWESSAPVDVEIHRHTSSADHIGARTAPMTSTLAGRITIQDPTYIRPALHGFLARNWAADGPRIDLVRPVVIDPNEQATASQRFGSAIAMYKTRDDPARPETIGNLRIIEPEVRDTRAEPQVSYAFYLRNEIQPDAVRRVSLINPTRLEGVAPGREAFIQGPVVVEDRHRVLSPTR